VVEVLSNRVVLDLRRGLLHRHLRIRDVAGRVTTLAERRLVSMAAPHMAALELTVTPENWSGRMEVRSGIDGDVTNSNVAEDQLLASRHLRTVRVGDDGRGDRVVGSRVELVAGARRRGDPHPDRRSSYPSAGC